MQLLLLLESSNIKRRVQLACFKLDCGKKENPKKNGLKQAQKIEHNVSKAANKKKQESNKKKRKHSLKISAEPRQGPQDDDDGRLTGEQTGECSTVSLFGLIELQREKAETEQKKLAGECESKVDGKRPLSAQVNIIIDQGKASGGNGERAALNQTDNGSVN